MGFESELDYLRSGSNKEFLIQDQVAPAGPSEVEGLASGGHNAGDIFCDDLSLLSCDLSCNLSVSQTCSSRPSVESLSFGSNDDESSLHDILDLFLNGAGS